MSSAATACGRRNLSPLHRRATRHTDRQEGSDRTDDSSCAVTDRRSSRGPGGSPAQGTIRCLRQDWLNLRNVRSDCLRRGTSGHRAQQGAGQHRRNGHSHGRHHTATPRHHADSREHNPPLTHNASRTMPRAQLPMSRPATRCRLPEIAVAERGTTKPEPALDRTFTIGGILQPRRQEDDPMGLVLAEAGRAFLLP